MQVQITVRKAHKIRKEIETVLAARRIPVSVALSGLDARHLADPAGAVTHARDSGTVSGIEDFIRLSGILSGLRIAIGRTNFASPTGVDALLARIADVDRRIKMWKQVEAGDVPDTDEVVAAKLRRAKTRSESPETRRYGEEDPEITVSLVDVALRARCADALRDLKRTREALDDERLAANAREHVEIADGDVLFLEGQQIV